MDMKTGYFTFLLFSTYLAPAVRSDSVFQLTDNDFDQYIKDKEAMLVDFYAPWSVVIIVLSLLLNSTCY